MKITPEIKLQYEVEKELAARLRQAPPGQRLGLYPRVYDELFQRLPQHPTKLKTADDVRRDIHGQMVFLRQFLKKDYVMLEIGPGNCAVAFESARHVRKVYGVDVVEKMTTTMAKPDNFELMICDGVNFSLPENSVNLAYSNQVVEHLHPDDMLEQTRNVCKALVPGGAYVCVTPNRITGPHDVSAWFDNEATCLHLKEYTTGELAALFRKAGFSRAVAYAGLHGRFARCPVAAIAAFEAALGVLPHSWARALARNLPLRMIGGIRLVGVK